MALRPLGEWLQATDEGVLLHTQVTPSASRNTIEAPAARDDGQVRLRIKVRAVAADNAANTAVCVLVAKWAEVSKTSVTVARGATSRQKLVAINGDGEALSARLNALAAALADKAFQAR